MNNQMTRFCISFPEYTQINSLLYTQDCHYSQRSRSEFAPEVFKYFHRPLAPLFILASRVFISVFTFLSSSFSTASAFRNSTSSSK